MLMFNSRSGIKDIQLTGLVHALKNTVLNLIRYMCRNKCVQFKVFVHFLGREWRKEFPNKMKKVRVCVSAVIQCWLGIY